MNRGMLIGVIPEVKFEGPASSAGPGMETVAWAPASELTRLTPVQVRS
jgi:hypothetical protein